MTRASSVLLCSLLASQLAAAAPFVPVDGRQILERLPAAVRSASTGEARAMREALAARPRDLGLALRVARHSIEQGRASADPRFLGYAQSALAPWWDEREPPAEVLLLRATIRQSQHRFEPALQDLSRLLERDPRNAQAWLTRATIETVIGRYADAARSCQALATLTGPLLLATCLAAPASLNGGAGPAYALLERALASARQASPQERSWALTLLAEIAARLGNAEAAERNFRLALALNPADVYLRAALADFLLDQGRPGEVAQVLGTETDADALLLRRALAARALRSDDAAALTRALGERFDAVRARGDLSHAREEARFALALLGQPEQALRLAEANWSAQREPADARVLLEAALAAGKPDAARPVLVWLDRHGVEDVVLASLARRARR